MTYRLPPGISYGFIDGGAVVLDLCSDRYLRLGRDQADALRALGDGALGRNNHPAIDALLARNLLSEGEGAIAPVAATAIGSSALEHGASRRMERAGEVSGPHSLEILLARLTAARWMQWAGLAATVARWRHVRSRRIFPSHGQGAIADLAMRYQGGLRYYPAKRQCVPDSLALMRCLWKRGHDADLYFGVRLDPFAAHCWVQAGAFLLTDPVDSIAEFTPVFRL